jgi:enamine deaminase RidA (YjgF/YER057c/UK114 family)
MKKSYLNPPGSPTPKSYHHVVVTEGGRIIFLSGQVAFNNERKIVGENDVVDQTRQTMRNLKAAVEAGGGQISDIVQITTHVVNYDPSQLNDITGTIAEFFRPECLPTNTLVGVTSLSTDGLLIEIGGMAITEVDQS